MYMNTTIAKIEKKPVLKEVLSHLITLPIFKKLVIGSINIKEIAIVIINIIKVFRLSFEYFIIFF